MKPGSGEVGEAREVGAHPKDLCLDLGPQWKRSWDLQFKMYSMRFLDLKLHVIKRFSRAGRESTVYCYLQKGFNLPDAVCSGYRLPKSLNI